MGTSDCKRQSVGNEARLGERLAWRGSSDDAFISAYVEFSQWLQSSDEAARYGIAVVEA